MPVVEVAGHDEGPLLRDRSADALAEPLQLEAPAARPEPQVHVDAVERFLPALDVHLAM